MSTANIPAYTCPLKFYQNIMTDGKPDKFMHITIVEQTLNNII